MQMIQNLALHYHEAKMYFSRLVGASEDLLHVHAGLLIFVITAFVLRRRFRSPVPILFVAAFAISNEVIDQISGTSSKPLEPYIDIVNTIFWPGILFLLAKRWK